jgi:hypothetical protein
MERARPWKHAFYRRSQGRNGAREAVETRILQEK